MVQLVMPSVASRTLILSTVAELQPFILMVLSLVQPQNIKLMSVTLLVSQPLKSRVVRELQLENIKLMSVTLLVFQPLTSKDVSLWQ